MCCLRLHCAVIPPRLPISKSSYKHRLYQRLKSSVACISSLFSPFPFIFLLSSLKENNPYELFLSPTMTFQKLTFHAKKGSNFSPKYLAGQLIFISQSCLKCFPLSYLSGQTSLVTIT